MGFVSYFLFFLPFALALPHPKDLKAKGEDVQLCSSFQLLSSLPHCYCSGDNGSFTLNCDNVVFFNSEYPVFPPRAWVREFSMKGVGATNIPPQVLSATRLEVLDLSFNSLRRISEKALEGLGETLQRLDLRSNLLGDQLNPIFSTAEFQGLPRLKSLILSENKIRKLDSGLFQGTFSLQELDLERNELNGVPTEALKGPRALRKLNLAHNFLEELSPNAFETQSNLLEIFLSHNSLRVIRTGAFNGLRSLRILDLSWNNFQRIESDTFSGLDSLEELDLSDNFLTEIPANQISPLLSLKKLNLGSNLIQNIQSEELSALRRLEELNLSRNRITSLPPGGLQKFTRLQVLNLSVNQLRTVPLKIFDGIQRLRKLDLSDNNLLTFPSGALEPLKDLEDLSLDFNRISAIQEILTVGLRRLSLANNLIRQIPSHTLVNLTKLIELHLEGNLLEVGDDLLLPESVQILHLGRNRLIEAPRFHLPNLTYLDISGNNLSTLLPHNFVLLPALKTLLLSKNHIRNLSDNTFDGLHQIQILDLSSNRLTILPKINHLLSLQNLNLSENNLKILKPIPLPVQLQVLDLSHNLLSELWRGPEGLFQNNSQLHWLSISDNKLNSFRGFGEDLPLLQALSLRNNHLTYVYPEAFKGLSGLEYLDFSSNRLTFFPTEALPRTLRNLSLEDNQFKNLQEMHFANFPLLQRIELGQNLIETLPLMPFSNSSQVQYLDLSDNKLEGLDENLFQGILRLDLDLSHNFLSTLPPEIFQWKNVQRLTAINLAMNSLADIPSLALQYQYFYLERLNLSQNRIIQVPSNLNVLVNVKELDMSDNPLSQASIQTLLEEPKTARSFFLSKTNTSRVPQLEMPFLRILDLSTNPIPSISPITFTRTTLLRRLNLSGTIIHTAELDLPLSIHDLDLSATSLQTIQGTPFPKKLRSLRLNSLQHLSRLEKAALNLPDLEEIEIQDSPKLGYLDIRGILRNLPFLQKMDFEVKDTQILDQIHSALSPRTEFVGLRGRQIGSISTGTFAGLTGPRITIALRNTSLELLPAILVPVPMSSEVTLDLAGSNIPYISPPFLSNNIKLEGVNPTCDCNAISLITYLQAIYSKAVCGGPSSLRGTPIANLRTSSLTCGSATSTTAIPEPPALQTFPTRKTTTDDIIWSLPPTTPKIAKNLKSSTDLPKLKTPEVANMDNLIIGIVGGVLGVLFLFILGLVCCLRTSSSTPHPQPHSQQKCTCTHQSQNQTPYGTVRTKAFHHSQGNLQALTPYQQHQLYASLPYFIDYERR